MDKEIAKQNLSKINKIFSENGIVCFLTYGSCLGIVRDKDIFDHDLDTDIGIMANDWNNDLLRQFIEAGFNILKIFGMFNYGCEISLAKNGVKTDVMFFYKGDNYVWNALWKNYCINGESDMIKHTYEKKLFDAFTYKKYESGEIFRVPQNFEDYLIRVYGKEWRVPVKKWNWQTDHKCIEKNEQ